MYKIKQGADGEKNSYKIRLVANNWALTATTRGMSVCEKRTDAFNESICIIAVYVEDLLIAGSR